MGNENPMLRYAPQHFESLRPYRWRLVRMCELTKPAYSQEHVAAVAALTALDRFAARMLDANQYARFIAPWFPEDQT